MKALKQRCTIIGLGVEDLVKSTAFYTEKFGWKITSDSNENISFINLNGSLLSLYPKDKLAEDATVDPEGRGFSGTSLAYNTETKEEVDQVFDLLSSRGVTIVKSPEEVFWGGYSGYVSDEDGYLWEIAYNPYMKMDTSGNVI